MSVYYYGSRPFKNINFIYQEPLGTYIKTQIRRSPSWPASFAIAPSMHSRACSGEHTNRLDVERTRCGIRKWSEQTTPKTKVLRWKVTCSQNAFLQRQASFVGSYLSCDVRHTATTQSLKLICWHPADLGRHAQVRHWASVSCFLFHARRGVTSPWLLNSLKSILKNIVSSLHLQDRAGAVTNLPEHARVR